MKHLLQFIVATVQVSLLVSCATTSVAEPVPTPFVGRSLFLSKGKSVEAVGTPLVFGSHGRTAWADDFENNRSAYGYEVVISDGSQNWTFVVWTSKPLDEIIDNYHVRCFAPTMLDGDVHCLYPVRD